MDEIDDLEARKCPKCHGLVIKQEIDETWYCEKCDKIHGDQEIIEDNDELTRYRNCVNCGKESGIFEYCKDCRPDD